MTTTNLKINPSFKDENAIISQPVVDQIRNNCNKHGYQLIITNHGEHWQFRHKNLLVEWWPSTNRLVRDKNYNSSRKFAKDHNIWSIVYDHLKTATEVTETKSSVITDKKLSVRSIKLHHTKDDDEHFVTEIFNNRYYLIKPVVYNDLPIEFLVKEIAISYQKSFFRYKKKSSVIHAQYFQTLKEAKNFVNESWTKYITDHFLIVS